VARQIESAYRTKLAKGEVGIHDLAPVPHLKDAMREFLSWSEREHGSHPRTHLRYKTSSKALLKYFGNPRLDALNPEEVERFKILRSGETGIRSKRPLRPATVNRELACGKAMFNFARKAHRSLLNPFAGLRMLPEDNEQMRVLSYEEQQKYLAEASQPLRDIAILMLETGMRPEEVYRITRPNVHLAEGCLLNPFGKTKAAKRKIPLTTLAIEVLRNHLVQSKKGSQTDAESPYLFPHERDAGKPMLKVNNGHQGALKRSKVPRFRLYDLRHTWATRAAMSGIDLVTLAAMLGHSRIQMVLRYAHPTQQHQVEAMRRLEQFNAAKQIAEFDGNSLQIPLQ